MAAVGRIGWVGVIAAGLGVGAALAAGPATAAPDPASDIWLAIDSVAAGLPAADTPDMDLAISFDGYTLFDGGGATASTDPGEFGFAFAYGDGSIASAVGGIGNTAFAIGANASAHAGGLTGDTGNDYNTAINIGNNSAPMQQGAFSGNQDLLGSGHPLSCSHNIAVDIGNNNDGSHIVLAGINGDGNTAIDIGNNPGEYSLVAGFNGDGNTAIDVGNNPGEFSLVAAYGGNDNYASQIGQINSPAIVQAFDGDHNMAISNVSSVSSSGTNTLAGAGDNNVAYVLGPDGSYATALNGDHNVATVFDPFGTIASHALAGGDQFAINSNYDLAAVLLTDGDATAQNSDFLYDILTALGHETGTLPTSLSDLLTEFTSLFG